jgi:gas vesicle protein
MAIKEQKEETEVKDTGKKFTEEIEEALTALISVTQRAKELTALRLQKDKRLSETAYDSISELQSEIQDIYDDLDTLLNVAAPEQIQIPDEEEVTDTIKKTIEILTNLQTVDI